jgi:hypothetical protein
MENRVNTMNSVGELERDGVRTSSSYNIQRALEFVREFCRRTSGVEEFGFDKCLLSYFEWRSRHASEVSQNLIMELGFSNSGL